MYIWGFGSMVECFFLCQAETAAYLEKTEKKFQVIQFWAWEWC